MTTLFDEIFQDLKFKKKSRENDLVGFSRDHFCAWNLLESMFLTGSPASTTINFMRSAAILPNVFMPTVLICKTS